MLELKYMILTQSNLKPCQIRGNLLLKNTFSCMLCLEVFFLNLRPVRSISSVVENFPLGIGFLASRPTVCCTTRSFLATLKWLGVLYLSTRGEAYCPFFMPSGCNMPYRLLYKPVNILVKVYLQLFPSFGTYFDVKYFNIP